MERESIELALQQLLGDARIAASPQMTAFICYVVEQTLDDRAERIKAYSVGVDALGKPESFDPQSDASVRVLAARLRKTLERYNDELPAGAVMITLIRGSYVPEFAVKQAPLPAQAPARAAAHQEIHAVSADTSSSDNEWEVPAAPSRSNEGLTAGGAEATPSGRVQSDRPVVLASAAGKTSKLPYVVALLAFGVTALLFDLPAKFSDEMPPDLAAATGEYESVSSDAPIIFIETPGEQHETARQVAFVLRGVLGQFDHIDVREAQSEGAQRARNPGAYVMSVSVLPIGSRLILGVQVVHEADGQLMFADSQDVTGDNAEDLTAAIDELRDSVARLSQSGGPLTGHFRGILARDKSSGAQRFAGVVTAGAAQSGERQLELRHTGVHI